MNLKDKMNKFNKRWNIQDDTSNEEKFAKFKTQIINIFKDIDNHVSKESIFQFCQFFGIPEKWHQNTYGDYEWSTNIIERLMCEDNEKEFYKLVEIIFSLDINATVNRMAEYTYGKKILLLKVIQAINFSGVNLELSVIGNDEIIFYPKGEKELDKKVVNEVLSFLDEKSQSHFVSALKFCQKNNKGAFIKSAESLRRSLEEFLKFKLKNGKGLNANIKELQVKLKKDNRDPQIRNIIFQVFSYMDQYFNENSKHVDGEINENENEFLIYQIGLLLRYINQSI